MGSAKGDPSAYGFHEGYLDTFEGTGSIAQELYICLSSSVLQANGERGRTFGAHQRGLRDTALSHACGLVGVAQAIEWHHLTLSEWNGGNDDRETLAGR